MVADAVVEKPIPARDALKVERANRDAPRRRRLPTAPGWAVSTGLHFVVLLLLAWMTLHEDVLRLHTLVFSTSESETEGLADADLSSFDVGDATSESFGLPTSFADAALIEAPTLPNSEASQVELAAIGVDMIPQEALLADGAVGGAGSLGGRSGASKADLLGRRGGGPATEEAVAKGLAWIAAHQLSDGGWNLNHTAVGCTCHGDPATLAPARNAATALGLLPLLAAGNTHEEGLYRANVARGLDFLVRNMQPELGGGSFNTDEATMYSQGLAATALCEAYAMTFDSWLREPATASLIYIVAAQDPRQGGWRYRPGDPGDVSVTGCLLIALKSGQMGLLNVPQQPFRKTSDFLRASQFDGGAQYRYMPGRRVGAGTTAIGLLSRMYLGWRPEHPSIQKGVRRLSRGGPSPDDMYFNFYATMLMSHYGGELWTQWNEAMKAQLLATQANTGHEAGSWYFDHHHSGRPGGRLCCTSLAVLTLEVYYRYLPLYQSTGDPWERFPD